MYCIISGTNDPFLNLAIEEILLKKRQEEFIILGINKPCVVIGKHQAAHREADTRYVTLNNIPVLRRITGGGTVFHDSGNINYTFIRNCESGKQVDFKKHTKPVIDFLASTGIDASFEGKNDIKTGGLKISGNAEHVHRNRILHHGTLLFDASLDLLKNSLRKDQSAYESRGVASNPSQVTNLKEMLPEISSPETFIHRMRDFLLDYFSGAEEYELTGHELGEAQELANSKYRTWEWNYAYGPEYIFSKEFSFEGQPASVRFHVREGIIRDIVPVGSEKMKKALVNMTGMRHMPEDLQDIAGYDPGLPDVFTFF